MFTGIITHTGKPRLLSESPGKDNHRRLCIVADGGNWDTPAPGSSIAVDGVCLTVAQSEGANMEFDVSQETLRCTTIGRRRPEHRVNLERAMAYGDEIGGHFVSGHVDRTIVVLSTGQTGAACRILFQLPSDYAPYITRKGSVCINGVSLTVNEVSSESFGVNIIPYTGMHTNLGKLSAGCQVNLETDILGRYMANLLNQSLPERLPSKRAEPK